MLICDTATVLLGLSTLCHRLSKLPTDHQRRIPNPSTSCSIRLFPLLFRRSWSLYVELWLNPYPLQPANESAVYIFVGSLLLADGIMDKIIGTLVGTIGIAYVVLEFVPSIEPPENMREADGGWGAEQV